MPQTPDTSPETDFLAAYASDVPVKINGIDLQLGQALAMEALACTGEPTRVRDPDLRVQKLAGMLAAANSLLPEHGYLIQQPTS